MASKMLTELYDLVSSHEYTIYASLLQFYVLLLVGNIGNVPLVLIAALCRDDSNPFGDSEKCSTDGIAYISFGQWVGFPALLTH